MRSFGQDVRYVVRLLLKTPAVTVVAVLSLALGIRANIAIFGVMNALLLRSLSSLSSAIAAGSAVLAVTGA